MRRFGGSSRSSVVVVGVGSGSRRERRSGGWCGVTPMHGAF